MELYLGYLLWRCREMPQISAHIGMFWTRKPRVTGYRVGRLLFSFDCEKNSISALSATENSNLKYGAN